MGQEIVYCHKCQSRLIGSDFEKGKAFRLQNVTMCAECAKSFLDSLPPAERAALQPAPKASTSRIPVLRSPDPPSGRHRPMTDSTNLRTPAAPPAKKSPVPLILGIVGGVVAVGLIVAVAASGGSGRRPPPPDPNPGPGPGPTPPIVRDVRPSPEREKEARRLHEQAKSFAIANPNDFAGQLDRFRQAAFAADGTPIAEEVKRDFEIAQARLATRSREEGTRLDEKTAPLVAQGQFKEAVAAIEAARGSIGAPEAERRAAAVKEAARAKFNPLKAAGVEAKQRRKDADLAKAREQAAALGIDDLLREFDQAIAVAVPLPAPPPPRPDGPALPLYEDGLANGWQNWSWSSTVNLQATPAFEGAHAASFTPSKLAAGFYLANRTPVEADQYTAITFALRRMDENINVNVVIYTTERKDNINVSIPNLLGAPEVGAWKRYVVPLSTLGVEGKQINGFILQSYKVSSEPLFFVDSVALLRTTELPKPAVAATPAAKAYHDRFAKAAEHAVAREYVQATKLLEEALAAADPSVKPDAQADLEGFRAIQALLTDVTLALSKWPRGQNLAVDVYAPAGRRRVDEPVRRSGTHRAEIRDGAGTTGVEYGEIAAASLADLYLSRAKRTEAETRAAALFCALEGDFAAAKRLYPALPDRYKEAARPGPREAEAQKLFDEAEREHAAYATRAASIEKYAKLLADYKDTAFVRRNLASLSTRPDTIKEFFFSPGDLKPAGAFSFQRHAKGEVGWTVEEDVADKAQRKDHYVEAEFSAPAGSEYRGWVFVGACCVETFTFFLQVTELEAPDAYTPGAAAKCEPGSAFLTPVVPSLSFLKKFHVQHGGRKEPTRFDWIALPVLKFPTAGPKKIRIISDQEGFTAAAVFVSAQRRQPPLAAEAAELERARPEVPPDGGASARTGVILREVWTNLPGDSVATLTGAPAFKGKPNLTAVADSFASPRDWADAYGTRMRGYLYPPVTGAYTFWLNTDDEGKLWLSPDDSPSTKAEICHQPNAPGYGNWSGSAKSKPINLIKGRRYYIEAMQKEGGGSDYLLVGWQLPDGTMERPIPGKRLSAFLPGAEERLTVSLTAPSPGTVIPAPGPLTVQADVQGPGTVAKVEIFQGSTRIGEAKGSPPSLSWNAPAPGAYPLAARVTERGGKTIVSRPSLVTIGEISLYRAINLNGAEAIAVDDLAWQVGVLPDVAKVGTGYERQDVELRHPTDPARARMLRSSIAAREGTKVTLSGAPAGKYLVYLYAWEPDESPLPFDVAVNGKPVLSSHKFAGAGDWARLGPWPVEVADGKIEVASRAFAHFSGIEVWRLGVLPPPIPTERAKTEIIGGPGGGAFEEALEGNPMITGFRVTVHEKRHIKTIQALYGEQAGAVHGTPSADKHEILAKPGYAVGGLQVRGADRVLAFQVVFMRIAGPVLNPADRYESGWIVGNATDTMMLVGTGAPIVGLHGRRGGDSDAFGLIFMK
jgi:hypothetical protein